MPDLAGGTQLLERVEPVALAEPGVLPHVQLEQVDGLEAEVVEAPLGRPAHAVAGYTSATSIPSGAGQMRFLGGTFVATYTRSGRSRTTRPTSRSLWPSPYARAVSMKFSPRSIARLRAAIESSSSAPIHCTPLIPQAP